jgi:hypothetical protein
LQQQQRKWVIVSVGLGQARARDDRVAVVSDPVVLLPRRIARVEQDAVVAPPTHLRHALLHLAFVSRCSAGELSIDGLAVQRVLLLMLAEASHRMYIVTRNAVMVQRGIAKQKLADEINHQYELANKKLADEINDQGCWLKNSWLTK